jgi:hypothetical protein
LTSFSIAFLFAGIGTNEAMAYVETGRAKGKVVVKVNPSA